MTTARITLDPSFQVGPVRRRTFGSFVEHLGRCVYTGIYDPEHPSADEDGFREDVIELVKDLGVSTVRYPGGNFVSGYRWEDGIGPVEERPTRLDLAWHSSDPNTVGVDEFMRWAKKADVEPMMAVNLGTRGVTEALDLLEYCNVPGGSKLSDLRREYGDENPYKVKMWCLGNEMDGPWQVGHKSAEDYGRLAAETARAMRMMDPDLELVACGSSSPEMETFSAWEYEVLSQTYELVDYISAHSYYWERDGDLASFLASGVEMDNFVDDVIATADAVRAKGKYKKRINISFDEWNVWYQKRAESVPPKGDDWPIAPVLLEDNYTVADAIVVGGLLISLLRHTDRVHSASLAQLVNVIAPIMTEPGGRVWKQTIFYPFAQASNLASGVVLQPVISSPTYETKRYGEVPVLDAVATWDEESGITTVFAVNRSMTDSMDLEIDLRAAGHQVLEATSYSSTDPYWAASADDDSSVVPVANETASVSEGIVKMELPPVSWNVIRLARA